MNADISFLMYDKCKKKVLVVIDMFDDCLIDEKTVGGELYEGSVIQAGASG